MPDVRMIAAGLATGARTLEETLRPAIASVRAMEDLMPGPVVEALKPLARAAERLGRLLPELDALVEDLGELGGGAPVRRGKRAAAAAAPKGAAPAALTSAGKLPRGTPRPHGTTGRYAQGCRCDECRGACATYQRERKARKSGRPAKPRKGKAAAGDAEDGRALVTEELITPAVAALAQDTLAEAAGDLVRDALHAPEPTPEDRKRQALAIIQRRRAARAGQLSTPSAPATDRHLVLKPSKTRLAVHAAAVAAGEVLCDRALDRGCHGAVATSTCGHVDCTMRARRCEAHGTQAAADRAVEAHRRGTHGIAATAAAPAPTGSPGADGGGNPPSSSGEARPGPARPRSEAPVADRKLWWRGGVTLFCRCTALVAGSDAALHLEMAHGMRPAEARAARETWPFAPKASRHGEVTDAA